MEGVAAREDAPRQEMAQREGRESSDSQKLSHYVYVDPNVEGKRGE